MAQENLPWLDINPGETKKVLFQSNPRLSKNSNWFARVSVDSDIWMFTLQRSEAGQGVDRLMERLEKVLGSALERPQDLYIANIATPGSSIAHYVPYHIDGGELSIEALRKLDLGNVEAEMMPVVVDEAAEQDRAVAQAKKEIPRYPAAKRGGEVTLERVFDGIAYLVHEYGAQKQSLVHLEKSFDKLAESIRLNILNQ